MSIFHIKTRMRAITGGGPYTRELQQKTKMLKIILENIKNKEIKRIQKYYEILKILKGE